MVLPSVSTVGYMSVTVLKVYICPVFGSFTWDRIIDDLSIPVKNVSSFRAFSVSQSKVGVFSTSKS